MRPLGLGGSRKLKDILIDAKVPRREREEILVLVGGGEILWVAGRLGEGWFRRRSESAKVEPGTGEVLALELFRPGLSGKK